MTADYAVLQLCSETDRESLTDVLVSRMAQEGLRPCGREAAERTVAFAPCQTGWAVYDDWAERISLPALDTLGTGLSRRFRCLAAGIMISDGGLTLRLYARGSVCDTYTAPRQSAVRQGRLYTWADCRRHALHWQPLLRSPAGRRELAEIFAQGSRGIPGSLDRLRDGLVFDRSARYGFKSLELEQPEGLIFAYFSSDTTVKQKLTDRLFGSVPHAGTAAGACLRRIEETIKKKPPAKR
ncbi:MAG: hypothetical protein HFJ80_00720 [Clostridiales bacterium]|nr:hypothetical protein [Clostridiales bacterium]